MKVFDSKIISTLRELLVNFRSGLEEMVLLTIRGVKPAPVPVRVESRERKQTPNRPMD